MEAIGIIGSAIGILAKDGVQLVGEKKVISKLVETSTSVEKMYKIYDHVACAVTGIMSNANILISTARLQSTLYVTPIRATHSMVAFTPLVFPFCLQGRKRTTGFSFT